MSPITTRVTEGKFILDSKAGCEQRVKDAADTYFEGLSTTGHDWFGLAWVTTTEEV
jgi:hypothetical protein